MAEGTDDEDEVLLELALQLRGMVGAVGGGAHAHVLLPPLEALASVEDASVRSRAVSALHVVLGALPGPSVLEHGAPVLRRLGARDWFTSRASACALLPRLVERLRGVPGAEAAAAAAFESFKELATGDEVMGVRRACALALPAMGTALAGGALPAEYRDGSDEGLGGGGRAGGGGGGARGGAGGGGGAPASLLALVENAGMDVGALPPPQSPPLPVSAASPAAGAAAAAALAPLAASFFRDEQDSVRLLAANAAVVLAVLSKGAPSEGAPSEGARGEALRLLAELARDASWRVRWGVCRRLCECGSAVPAEDLPALLRVFVSLLGDATEVEVRVAAALHVARMGALCGPALCGEALVPGVTAAIDDDSEHVRAAVASVLLELAPTLGAGRAIDALVPPFLKLLKDPSPHVRLNVLAKLPALSGVVNVKTLGSSLLPALKELSEDRAWRVRLATIDFTATAARLLGVDCWAPGSEATAMCLAWLTDGTFAIREAAALNLARLANEFGAPWVERALLPKVLALAESAGKRLPPRAPVVQWQNVPIPSTHRMTALMALAVRALALTQCARPKRSSV